MSPEMAGFTPTAQYLSPNKKFIFKLYNITLMALEKREISNVAY